MIRLYVKQLLAKNPNKAGKINLMEALSASGLRSIRYAKEIPDLDEIIANDISKKAVDTIRQNIINNGVEGKVKASHNGFKLIYLFRIRHTQSMILFFNSFQTLRWLCT